MRIKIFKLLGLVIAMAAVSAPTAYAQKNRRVVHPVRHPVARARLVRHPGHPIHRVLPANVVVRNARRTVIVGAPLRYLPAFRWRPALVTLPARELVVWQDTQSIARDEEWVDVNYGVDGNGSALVLDLDGEATLNYAEVTFANGNVQVVDFDEQSHGKGTYKLLDLGADQHVMTVRVLAKSESDETKLAVYLNK
jgi:hypothetical protein